MSDNARKLGQVTITQVQPSGLKFEVQGTKIYDPSHLETVPYLNLNSRDVEGKTERGEQLMDIHHADHPNTHNNGTNAISIGFAMGPMACSSSVAARPSQNCASLRMRL